MAHRFKATEYLGYINHETRKPCRIINAKYKGLNLDVFYEDLETGKKYCRNLVYSHLTGYMVEFPGEVIKNKYYGNYVVDLEEWSDFPFDTGGMCATYERNEIDYYVLMDYCPDCKFMLKKLMKLSETYYIPLHNIFGCIRLFREHPEMEYFICHEFFYLMHYRIIYRYSKQNKKLLMDFLKKHRDYFKDKNNPLGITEIMDCAKNKIDPNFYWLKRKYSQDVFEYLIKNDRWQLGLSYYEDYRTMAREMKHDMNDPYWKYPKDLKAAHDKVMEEKKIYERNKEAEKQVKLSLITKSLQKNNQKVEGFKIFIANTVDQFVEASEVLHQCLMRANYIDKVINQKCIIVMIWKDDGTPIATAEVGYDKEVHQFYGDEKDHNNCKPTQEIQDMFYSWLEGCKFRKRRITTEM